MANDVTYADIQRALDDQDPQFVDLVVRYLAQPDPPETKPEDFEEVPGQSSHHPPLPQGTWTMSRLKQSIAPAMLSSKGASERKAARKEAWEGIMEAPYHPPRLDLGALFIKLYESRDRWAHRALMGIFKRARLGLGVWKAFKAIYKQAEAQHDAAMFGVLAWRLDAFFSTHQTGEISPGTLTYMRRRPWRYLRELGRAVPEIYPQFAAQVLRHYPKGFRFNGAWTANQIWNHENLIGEPGPSVWGSGPSDKLKDRAYHEAWKISAEPLLRLLEDAENDAVCDFAIRSLQADFPDELRRVDAVWLARIGKKPLASVHNFIVGVLSDSPELHQSKLAGLGLHDMVLSFLESDSNKARVYAVEYARAHAPNIPVEKLVHLAVDGQKEVKAFALDRLGKQSGKDIGLPLLILLLRDSGASNVAQDKIKSSFTPEDLDAELFIRLATGNSNQTKFVKAWFKEAEKKVPARFYTALLDDTRCGWSSRREAIAALGDRKGAEIGAEWLKKALMNPQLQHNVASWLRSGKLSGPDLDVEWVKGLVMRPALRSLAIDILKNRKLVAPSAIGLGWLLAMARQPDDALHQFAHRYLLENFAPDDFALEMGSTEISVGIDRIWQLAAGPKEPEPVRAFAATYLRVHHPELGPTLQESRQLGIKPKLPREAYSAERVRPLFQDERQDVRRLAASLAKMEIVRWGDRALLYDLCDSTFREGRALAADALLSIGRPDADDRYVPPADWIDGGRIFLLAESSVKATREIALTLIRQHYAQIGGARRLAWLMESPDREVRLFAVRLLWDKHRPRDVPDAWRPAKGHKEGLAAPERFDSVEALRLFLRTVMFGLPPGRMERRELSGDAMPDRALPASVAKRRLLEVVRDLALESEGFARIALPVLEEFMHSQAKGEWQGCVAALAHIRREHPHLEMALPPAQETRAEV